MDTTTFKTREYTFIEWLENGRVMMLLGLFVILPHLLYLPIAISCYILFIWAFFFLLICTQKQNVIDLFKIPMILIALIFFAVLFKDMTVGEIGNALLCLVIAIIPVESDTRKSINTFILICYFNIISFFFRGQHDAWLLYYLVFIVLLTVFNQKVEFPKIRFPVAIKETVLLMLQAIPLMLILFFLFPRLSEPLVNWNPYHKVNESGIADQIELGEIGKLSLSDEVAFKVRFEGSKPEHSNLYWRGPIFDYFDGRVWDSSFFSRRSLQQSLRVDSTQIKQMKQVYQYEIIQEANNKNWLIALDMPVTDTENAFISEEYQLITEASINERMRYSVTSAIDYKTPIDPEYVYSKSRQVPRKKLLAQQTLALGKNLRTAADGQSDSELKIIQNALLYFSENPFYYTYNAPTYQENPLDQFMFKGQTGYCTHFASSLTMMLRAANIPARMVTGYRGGEWNEVGEYFIVRQKHAHAWVEAWVEEFGWIRIDPSSVIPDQRMLDNSPENSNRSVLSENISQRVNESSELQQLVNLLTQIEQKSMEQNQSDEQKENIDSSNLFSDLVDKVQASIKYAANYSQYFWDSWIIGFDYERQKTMFDLSNSVNLLLMLGLISILICSYFSYIFLMPALIANAQQQPVQNIYKLLQNKLGKNGIHITTDMTHHELLSMAMKQHFFDKQMLHEIFVTYEKLRYAKNENDVTNHEIKSFREQVKNFLT